MTMHELLKRQSGINENDIIGRITEIEATIYEAWDWYTTRTEQICDKPDINEIVQSVDWMVETLGEIFENVKELQALAHSQQQIAKELQSSTCKISKK